MEVSMQSSSDFYLVQTAVYFMLTLFANQDSSNLVDGCFEPRAARLP